MWQQLRDVNDMLDKMSASELVQLLADAGIATQEDVDRAIERIKAEEASGVEAPLVVPPARRSGARSASRPRKS